jgi:hypothetical protein
LREKPVLSTDEVAGMRGDNQLILLISTLSSRRGSLALLQPIVFTIQKSCVDAWALPRERG